MHFGPILTFLELFIGWVPEKSKSIRMNIIIKILLISVEHPDFLICCRGLYVVNCITYVKIRKKKNAELKTTASKFGQF